VAVVPLVVREVEAVVAVVEAVADRVLLLPQQVLPRKAKVAAVPLVAAEAAAVVVAAVVLQQHPRNPHRDGPMAGFA
jgi:prophage DNA circulation protein